MPTVADTVPGFESTTWFGVFGPKGLPQDIVQRLNTEINAVLKKPEFRERLKTLGLRRRRRHTGATSPASSPTTAPSGRG